MPLKIRRTEGRRIIWKYGKGKKTANVKNVKRTATDNVNEVNDVRKKQRIDNFIYLIILLDMFR